MYYVCSKYTNRIPCVFILARISPIACCLEKNKCFILVKCFINVKEKLCWDFSLIHDADAIDSIATFRL